jgi:hypothetical protein
VAVVRVGEIEFKLPAIDPAVDAAFVKWYDALFNNVKPDESEFDLAVTPFLTSATSFAQHDAYFNNFTPLWNFRLAARQHPLAAAIWPWALRPALKVEQTTSRSLHKGTPYYFWGMTLLLGNSLQDGYLMLHRALEEDFRTHGSRAPNTPGYALATLDHTKPDQALRQWVQVQAAAVEGRLESYRRIHGRKLDLAGLRTKYLAVPAYREPVQMYCYSMARVRRLLELPEQVWEGSFPAQVAFDTLFDLCLVIDDALHNRNPSQWQFIDHAEMLASRASLGLSKAELRVINGSFQTDFARTLADCLAGAFRLRSGIALSGLAASLAVAYGCRNRGAHNVAAVALTRSAYDQITQRLNDVFFLTIEELY